MIVKLTAYEGFFKGRLSSDYMENWLPVINYLLQFNFIHAGSLYYMNLVYKVLDTL